MSKFTLAVSDPKIKVRYGIPGLEMQRVITVPQWRFMVSMAKKWQLPFKFEERGDWYSILPAGIVTNAAAIKQWRDQRMMRREYVERFENAKQQLEIIEGLLKDRPRFAVLEQAIIDRFVKTLVQWEEVLESGLPGEELSAAAPRWTVPQDARMGVRLQPVKFRKYIAGKEFWVITPPMPFSLHADRIMAQAIGHPHVYAGEMKLCVGDAKFDYGNPFQVVGTLREWYVGYAPRDVADKQWVEHSRMWWKANGQAYLEQGGLMVEAPDKEHPKSSLVPITADDIARFCKSSGWVGEPVRDTAAVVVPEVRLEAKERFEGITWNVLERSAGEMCAIGGHTAACNRLGYYTVEQQERRRHYVYLCDCHLAELGVLAKGQYNAIPNQEARPLELPGLLCQCNYFITQDPVGTLPATHATVEGYAICAGHAQFLRQGLGGNVLAPHAELDTVVLSGELGSGKRQNAGAYRTLFPKRDEGWATRCAECGEALEAHWGLACPRNAEFRLAADDPSNRLGIEAWSRFDFEALPAVLAEVGALKARFAADKKLRAAGFDGMVRRLVGADGTALDEPGGLREHWVVDTLRKFGRDVTPDTRCLDCGGKWEREEGSHNGPDCVAQ